MLVAWRIRGNQATDVIATFLLISLGPRSSKGHLGFLGASGASQLKKHYLGGGFKHFLFSPLFGEDSHFD